MDHFIQKCKGTPPLSVPAPVHPWLLIGWLVDCFSWMIDPIKMDGLSGCVNDWFVDEVVYWFFYINNCYLLIYVSNIATTDTGLDRIAEWVRSSTLHDNHDKYQEVIIWRPPYQKFGSSPPPTEAIEWLTVIKVLGVTFLIDWCSCLHILLTW